MVATNDQIYARLGVININVQASLNYMAGVIQQINALGGTVSELDQSVEALQAAFSDLAARIDEPQQALEAALVRIGELNAEIAAAQSDDAADEAAIAALTAERDELLADSQENVTKIQTVTGQIQGLAQPTP